MLSKMNDALMQLVARFRCERGQALAEYSLILAFIFVACIFSLGVLGLAIMGQLDRVTAGF
jgi:Flp pilus assembly pilin Flp